MSVRLDPAIAVALAALARECLPREACALLAATSATADALELVRFLPIPNSYAGHDGFQMDPIAVARADAEFRTSGLRLAASFHSHPGAPPNPSAADQHGGWTELTHLILGGDEAEPLSRWSAWRVDCRGQWIEATLNSAGPPPTPDATP